MFDIKIAGLTLERIKSLDEIKENQSYLVITNPRKRVKWDYAIFRYVEYVSEIMDGDDEWLYVSNLTFETGKLFESEGSFRIEKEGTERIKMPAKCNIIDKKEIKKGRVYRIA